MAKNPRPPARQPNPAQTAAAAAARQNSQIVSQSQHWAGPLPPPAALAQFNDIIPNGAERIMAMVEQEQIHRASHEMTILNATVVDTRRGHWLGAAISLASIAGAVFTAHIGAPAAVSIALVGLPLVSIIQAIVNNKTRK